MKRIVDILTVLVLGFSLAIVSLVSAQRSCPDFREALVYKTGWILLGGWDTRLDRWGSVRTLKSSVVS